MSLVTLMFLKTYSIFQVLVQLVADAAPEPAVEGAAAAPAAAHLAVPAAAPGVNNNLMVNLDSSNSDEGNFSDHELYENPHENERTR